jgi:hypothetical protein
MSRAADRVLMDLFLSSKFYIFFVKIVLVPGIFVNFFLSRFYGFRGDEYKVLDKTTRLGIIFLTFFSGTVYSIDV